MVVVMKKDIINKTLEYLKKNYPQNQQVNVIICEGFDCIEGPDGTKGFGVFVPDTLEIYIPTDVPEPETTLIETLAHEYKHFIQHCEGQPFDEEEAESFAMYILHKLHNQERV